MSVDKETKKPEETGLEELREQNRAGLERFRSTGTFSRYLQEEERDSLRACRIIEKALSQTMEERYKKAMGLMGYKLTDTPIDSMATVTFIRGGDGQDAIRCDGWEAVGYVLEERLPELKGKLASEIKGLLYPQGNLEDALCEPEKARCRYRKHK